MARHKPFWHIRKLNKAQDEPLTEENKEFIQDFVDKKYSGPLKQVRYQYAVLCIRICMDPHHIGNLDPDPRQIIIWIRIRINLQVTSHNLRNMSLLDHFFMGLSLYLEARIWIWICIRIRIK